MGNIKTYTELITISTYLGRFEYLKLSSRVGAITFGSNRYLNQILYNTPRWNRIRDRIIIRDNGCDLGIAGREIYDRLTIHHIEAITIEDILADNPKVWCKDNLITSADITHKAIHYGNADLLMKEPIIRREYDTCPWKNKNQGGII